MKWSAYISGGIWHGHSYLNNLLLPQLQYRDEYKTSADLQINPPKLMAVCMVSRAEQLLSGPTRVILLSVQHKALYQERTVTSGPGCYQRYDFSSQRSSINSCRREGAVPALRFKTPSPESCSMVTHHTWSAFE